MTTTLRSMAGLPVGASEIGFFARRPTPLAYPTSSPSISIMPRNSTTADALIAILRFSHRLFRPE